MEYWNAGVLGPIIPIAKLSSLSFCQFEFQKPAPQFIVVTRIASYHIHQPLQWFTPFFAFVSIRSTRSQYGSPPLENCHLPTLDSVAMVPVACNLTLP